MKTAHAARENQTGPYFVCKIKVLKRQAYLKPFIRFKFKELFIYFCEVVLFNVISDFLLGNNYSNKLDFFYLENILEQIKVLPVSTKEVQWS